MHSVTCKSLFSFTYKQLQIDTTGKSSIALMLYTNIDQKLRNKLHGPMHYKIGVKCIFNGHEMHTVVITRIHLVEPDINYT